MLFAIQAYIEDFILRRNFNDSDGYAVHVSNLYFHKRLSLETKVFLRRMRRIRTVFFENNKIDNRAEFEQVLLERLDKKFKKNLLTVNHSFPGGLDLEKRRLQKLPRRTVLSLLRMFKQAVEAKAIDQFWLTRTQGKLRSRPEKIAQGLLAVFLKGILGDKGIALREIASGIGFIDIGVVLTRVLHIVELKVLTKSFIGPGQLEQYMRTEGRSQGYLLVVDALPPSKKIAVPDRIQTSAGTITVTVVDVNPLAPSKQSLAISAV